MTHPRTLGVGFSSCPNDTFMFHGVISGAVALPGLALQPWMADIEVLNERARGELDQPPLPITKISTAALAEVTERYTVLSSGAALGFGCGPIVVRRADDGHLTHLADLRGLKVAVPGLRTTAGLLMKMFGPVGYQAFPIRFDQIVDAVASGQVDAGVIIHETRFTYADKGLECVADLGEIWERLTQFPLPLGVIVADRTLGPDVIGQFEAALRRSVEMARADPGLSQAYVAQHAQEMSPEVCAAHINLYVNDFSVDLGEGGRSAIDDLLARARTTGFTQSPSVSPWR